MNKGLVVLSGVNSKSLHLLLLLLQRHTAQLREELLKLPCPDGLEPDCEEFSERSQSLLLLKEPSQEAEKAGGSQDNHCSEGQL